VKRLLVLASVVALCAGGSEGHTAACTITGTDGPDILLGTPGRDVICALGGDDQVAGLNGDDVLLGGAGNDTIEGGAGHDTMLGGAGNDSFRSYDATRDVLDGGPGRDYAWTDHLDKVRSVERLG